LASVKILNKRKKQSDAMHACACRIRLPFCLVFARMTVQNCIKNASYCAKREKTMQKCKKRMKKLYKAKKKRNKISKKCKKLLQRPNSCDIMTHIDFANRAFGNKMA
jgi:hypothetical protein